MPSYTLFGVDGSGNCLKVRMLLGWLGLSYTSIAPSLKPASEDLLAVNPLGQVPVLVVDNDDGSRTVVRDSNSILVYLALEAKAENWYPVSDAARCAKVQEWLSYGTSEVNHALLWVRIKNKFSWEIPVEYEVALERGRAVLAFVESQLVQTGGQPFLIRGDAPTLADIAVFPYVALAESSSDAAIKLADYPNVHAWVERIKALPDMTQMPPW